LHKYFLISSLIIKYWVTYLYANQHVIKILLLFIAKNAQKHLFNVFMQNVFWKEIMKVILLFLLFIKMELVIVEREISENQSDFVFLIKENLETSKLTVNYLILFLIFLVNYFHFCFLIILRHFFSPFSHSFTWRCNRKMCCFRNFKTH
jgi:hypothetical protein